jgi:hypothetical protein
MQRLDALLSGQPYPVEVRTRSSNQVRDDMDVEQDKPMASHRSAIKSNDRMIDHRPRGD